MTAQVMIVDDLLPNIKLLKAMLEREFYQVITATNGVKALERLRTDHPDIILLDVMMPEMDGLETCRRIKSDPATSDIPVVMVTALSDISDRIAGLNAGADDFLTKPINNTAMFARIRSLVRFKTMTDALKLRARTGTEFGGESLSLDKINDVSGAKILVIEDDEAQIAHIKEATSSLKTELFVYSDPGKAIKSFSERSYDLVIIDSCISEANSLHLCATLKSQEHAGAAPLILLVEEDDEDLIARGYDIGINDYLVMPLDSNEIRARCKTQIRRKKYQDALLHDQDQTLALSQRDGLTGLYNRRYFDSYFAYNLQEALRHSKPLALMVLDIDHFKRINDTYGHQAGDEVLKIVAKKIDVRASDLVARYGGEEFIVVMPNTPLSVAANVAERVRRSIEATSFPVKNGEENLKITVSIGLSCATRKDDTETLMSKADTALYHVKNTSRNRVAVNIGM